MRCQRCGHPIENHHNQMGCLGEHGDGRLSDCSCELGFLDFTVKEWRITDNYGTSWTWSYRTQKLVNDVTGEDYWAADHLEDAIDILISAGYLLFGQPAELCAIFYYRGVR